MGRVLRRLSILIVVGILLLLPLAYSQNNLTITSSTNKPQYTLSDTVTIMGRVLDNQSNPLPGATVSIQVNDPYGTTIHIQLTFSDQLGAYRDSFALSPNSPQGLYQVYVSVSKSGYENAQSHLQFEVLPSTVTTTITTASSQTTTTSSLSNVTTSKCFIATATYGSEVSPEVALLRNFRDADIVETLAGSSFMIAFNAFYYSFSSQVATVIASNILLRTMMKIILYPMIGILFLTNQVFIGLSFRPELAVIVSGIFASFAAGMVYLGPIIIVVTRLAGYRRFPGLRAKAALIADLCVSLTVLLNVAEALRLRQLLIFVTSATVLAYLMLGGAHLSIWHHTVEDRFRS